MNRIQRINNNSAPTVINNRTFDQITHFNKTLLKTDEYFIDMTPGSLRELGPIQKSSQHVYDSVSYYYGYERISSCNMANAHLLFQSAPYGTYNEEIKERRLKYHFNLNYL